MPEHTRINDLPQDERPREKMQRLGASALSAAELLAIFLRTGTQGASAIDIGRDLIAKHQNLSSLGRLKIDDLKNEHGLGLAKACQLAAAFELGLRASRENLQNTPLDTPKRIEQYFSSQLQYRNTEVLMVATLTSKFHLRRVIEISHGTADGTLSFVRDVIRPALIDQAPAFLVIHNHPSGDPTPSTADQHFTKRLNEAADLFHLTLADHVIIGRSNHGHKGYYSFRENNRLH